MANGRIDVEALKASLSITQVAERLGHKVVRGKMRCPYAVRHSHGDRTPSVSISESKGLFNCWVCPDVRGDIIKLVEISRNVDFVEAVNWLQSEFVLNTPTDPSVPLPHPPMVKVLKKAPEPEIDPILRTKIILSFFEMLSPIENTPAASYLVKRRIFKKTWDTMRLRTIVDYDKVNRGLLEKFGLEDLQKAGLYNEKGNLRYYRHRLLFPYLDSKIIPRYFQARSIEPEPQFKELNLAGQVPFPYNVSLLDGKSGWIYLCEGVIDTLTMIDRGFPAVGIPGVKSFKPDWVNYFKNKKVIICLDQDDPGRTGAKAVQELLEKAGVEASQLGAGIESQTFQMSEGQDINSWFGGKK